MDFVQIIENLTHNITNVFSNLPYLNTIDKYRILLTNRALAKIINFVLCFKEKWKDLEAEEDLDWHFVVGRVVSYLKQESTVLEIGVRVWKG